MRRNQLRIFLESLGKSSLGCTIDQVEIDRASPRGIAMCNMWLRLHTKTQQMFELCVSADVQGQVRFSHNIPVERTSRPERLSAALIELCNELNMDAHACSMWLVAEGETERPFFTVAVTKVLSVPVSLYLQHKKIARELYCINIDHFVEDAIYLRDQLCKSLGRLSEQGFFDRELVDVDDGITPSEH